MQKYDTLLETLRARLPEYMAQKGILLGSGKRQRMIHCLNPAHPDRHPSMSYFAAGQKLKCFACGVSYDIFDVIAMDYPACDSFPRQVKKACDLFGIAFPEDFGRTDGERTAPAQITVPVVQALPEPEPDEPPAPDHTAEIERRFAENGAGGRYLAARGIPAALCEKYRLFEAEGRAWLPVWEGGRCVSWCGRALDDQTRPRYKNSTGTMGIFGADFLRGEGEGGVLFITESIFDALSAEACGQRAIALCGAANVGKFLSLCRENPAAANGYRFVAAGDADEAGRKMNDTLKEGLRAQGLACTALQLPEGVKDLNELLVKNGATLHELLTTAADADARQYAATSASAALGDLLNEGLRRASRKACSTGFARLDGILDGGLYSGLYIIGAISSLGKTSFVLQIADAIAASGSDVLYFSLEMSRMELMAKSLSRLTWQLDPSAGRRDAFTVRQILRISPDMTAEQGMVFGQAVAVYKKEARGMFIREGIGDISAGEIREAVREHIRLRHRRPVVVVDYLQILKPTDPRATDKQNTDRSVVELKRISRDFDLPVLAISSFNRENYRSAVSMEAFKESGAVEYSSDVLMGLQLAGQGETGFDVNAAKSQSPRAVELVMLKNRAGLPWAKIEYAYVARHSYFGEGAMGSL